MKDSTAVALIAAQLVGRIPEGSTPRQLSEEFIEQAVDTAHLILLHAQDLVGDSTGFETEPAPPSVVTNVCVTIEQQLLPILN